MARANQGRWLLLGVVNVLFWCVLSFYQTGTAAPQDDNLPFANSVQQRIDMVTQLKEINAELKAQNALLRSGTLKVIVTQEKKR